MDLARHRGIISEPALEMVAVRAVGTKRIDAFTIDITATLDRAVVERRNNNHLLFKYRDAFQGWMQHGPVDERGHQSSRQHAIDHRAGRFGGQVQFDLGVLLIVGRQQCRNTHSGSAFQ